MKHHIIGALLVMFAYLAGEGIAYYAALPVPSALLGLLLLLVILFKFPRVETSVAFFVTAPLKHMSLFFVPAVMGVTLYWKEICHNSLAIGLAVIVTTAFSLLLTALVAQRLLFKKDKHSCDKVTNAVADRNNNG